MIFEWSIMQPTAPVAQLRPVVGYFIVAYEIVALPPDCTWMPSHVPGIGLGAEGDAGGAGALHLERALHDDRLARGDLDQRAVGDGERDAGVDGDVAADGDGARPRLVGGDRARLVGADAARAAAGAAAACAGAAAAARAGATAAAAPPLPPEPPAPPYRIVGGRGAAGDDEQDTEGEGF